MTRRDFLDALQKALTNMQATEREEAISYYEELLNDMDVQENDPIPDSWPSIDELAEELEKEIPFSSTEAGQSGSFDMIPMTEVKELDIRMRLGSIDIEYADVEQAQIKQPHNDVGQEINYQILFSIEGNKLFLRDEYENNYLSRLNRVNLPPAILRLPKNTYLDNLHVDMKMGANKMYGLQCKQLKVQNGMGSSYMQNVKAQKAEFHCQMGSMKLDNCHFYGSNIRAEMGSIRGIAELKGHNRLQADMGSIRLRLAQNRKDCSIQARSSMGSVDIKVNGRNLPPVEQTGYQYNSTIDATSTMGSILLNFIGNPEE